MAKVAEATLPYYAYLLDTLGASRCAYSERPSRQKHKHHQFSPGFGTNVEITTLIFCGRVGMFESNFPVDKLSFSYGVCWNAFKRVAAKANLSAEDKEWAFAKTARTVYNLGSAGGEAAMDAKAILTPPFIFN